MNYRLVTSHNQTYLECLPDGDRLASEREALELVAACGENETARLMVHAASLVEDFYHIKTGLAGSILQKFNTYPIRCAMILNPKLVHLGHFRDMVIEANRGNQFHVFYDQEPAEQWLVGIDLTF